MARSAALPLVLLCQTNGASAQDDALTAEGASLNIILNGQIPSDCGVGGGGVIALGEMTGSEQVSTPFDLTCNVPFELVFTSASGGMVHEDKPLGEGPYKGTVPYQLDVTVAGKSPRPVELTGRFDSASMIAGTTLSSGEAIAAARGQIVLQNKLREGDELLAGRYKDSIRITINPRV